MKKTRSQLVMLGFILLAIGGVFALALGINELLPPREVIQDFLQQFGPLGYIIYLLFGITAVFIVPLNFSLTGIIGTYVYGFWVGLITNWICKIIGTTIAFNIGKKLGPKIYPLFNKEKVAYFRDLMDNEKVVMIYFLLSSLPFTPSDAMAYFLGCSPMKNRVFIPITLFGSFGTRLGLVIPGKWTSARPTSIFDSHRPRRGWRPLLAPSQ